MVNNIIRTNDTTYIVSRILSEGTSEENATRIHHMIGTDTLMRDRDGKWFCCFQVKDVQHHELEVVDIASTEPTGGVGSEMAGGNEGLG